MADGPLFLRSDARSGSYVGVRSGSQPLAGAESRLSQSGQLTTTSSSTVSRAVQPRSFSRETRLALDALKAVRVPPAWGRTSTEGTTP